MTRQFLSTNKKKPKRAYEIIAYAFEQQEISLKHKEELTLEYQTMLNNLVFSYTHECSTSISETNFIHLMHSYDYVLQHANVIPIFKHLNYYTMFQLYNLGILHLQKDTSSIELLLCRLQKKWYVYQNDRYLDVIFHQIPNYIALLKNKDAQFNYHHTKEDFDYPLIDGLALFMNMYHKCGTDFVLEYLKRLTIEQTFCTLFKDEIPILLEQYEHIRGIHPYDIHTNLFEIVLYQWIANMILFQKPKLSLTKQDCIRLKQIVAKHTTIQHLIPFLHESLQTIDKTLLHYLIKHKTIIQAEWEKFANTSYNLFIYEAMEEDYITFHLTQAKTNLFKVHLAKLSYSQLLETKLLYIKESQIDLYDMFDLLDHGIFYGEEYCDYFKTLSYMEIGMFLKLLLGDITNLHFTSFEILLNAFDPENDWQISFKDYLQSTSKSSKKQILMFVSKLKFI